MRTVAALALLALVLMVGIASTCSPCRAPIEASLAEEAKARLAANGFGQVNLQVHYLDATLTGKVANAAEKERAASLVAGVEGLRLLPANNQLQVGQDISAASAESASLTIDSSPTGLTLTGRVPTEGLKTAIATAASVARPGTPIQNDLRVLGGIPQPAWAEKITDSVSQLLRAAPQASLALASGGATLRGTAPTAEAKQQAAAIAQSLVGTAGKVEDHLTLPPATQLSVKAIGQTVTLAGTVASEASKLALEAAAKSARPQAQISNQLSVAASGGPAAWEAGASAFLPTFLRGVTDGDLTLSGGQAALSGSVASPESKQQLISAAQNLLGSSGTLSDQLTVAAPAQSTGAWLDLAVNGEDVTVAGVVPTEALKTEVLGAVKAELPIATIQQDALKLDPQVPAPTWAGKMDGFVRKFLAASRAGRFQLREGSLALTGDVANPQAKEELNLAAKDLTGGGAVDDLTVVFAPSHKMSAEQEAGLTKQLAENALYFDSGKDQPKAGEWPKAEKVAQAAKSDNGALHFSVGGYADQQGDAAANKELSMKRALTVKRKLVELGVPASHMVVQFFGEEAGQNETDSVRSRRVEIKLRK